MSFKILKKEINNFDFFLLVATILLSIADYWLTIVGIHKGIIVEGNPIMAYFFDSNSYTLGYLYKLIGTTFGTLFIFYVSVTIEKYKYLKYIPFTVFLLMVCMNLFAFYYFSRNPYFPL